MILYHGSMRAGIDKLIFDKKNQITTQLVSGDGIYCTDSFKVAECYAKGGSVYELDADINFLFDATKEENFVELLKEVEDKLNIKIIKVPMVADTIRETADGPYSIREFGQSIKVILENDPNLLEDLDDYELTDEVKTLIDKKINSFDCIKYKDYGIDNGEALVFLILNPDVLTISKETSL